MQQKYRRQQMKRLSWMPWLYQQLKPSIKEWVDEWQQDIQASICDLETVSIGKGCFISPDAVLFAEPGRDIVIGDYCSISAQVMLHGPIQLSEHVSINHQSALDGGQKGIVVGAHSRIAHGCSLYAFNHQMSADRLIREQPVSSSGILIGEDLWLGARTCVADGVAISDHAVVGMGSVVTKDVPAWQKVAGVPARPIGIRR